MNLIKRLRALFIHANYYSRTRFSNQRSQRDSMGDFNTISINISARWIVNPRIMREFRNDRGRILAFSHLTRRAKHLHSRTKPRPLSLSSGNNKIADAKSAHNIKVSRAIYHPAFSMVVEWPPSPIRGSDRHKCDALKARFHWNVTFNVNIEYTGCLYFQ